ASTQQFFHFLAQKNPSGVFFAGKLLSRLSSHSPAASKTLLRLLVEGALRGSTSALFGAKTPQNGMGGDEKIPPQAGKNLSLLDTNRHFAPALNSTGGGGVWAVFHAGVIGKGLKPPHFGGVGDEEEEGGGEEVGCNTQVFLSVLLRCCFAGGGGKIGGKKGDVGGMLGDRDGVVVPAEAAKAVALAVVEAVCPEVAGGELVWPPEDPSRGGVERDLGICRHFR
ncbi:INT5 protein, partial [Turnix velox]|nr:INT5 protein [Turnix velox]